MTNSRYWDRVQKSRLSRRAMLAASARAGVGAAGLTLVGCGDDDDEAAQQQQAAVAAVDTAARTHGATLRIGWDLSGATRSRSTAPPATEARTRSRSTAPSTRPSGTR